MVNNINHNLKLEREDSSIKQYLQEISKYPLLTKEEEIELTKIIESGTKQEKKVAREKMINSNLRLVVSIAKKYKNKGLPFLDLIQEGNLGLMRAIETYDYSENYRFSTYATCWISQTIVRAIINKSKNIRIPVHAHEKILKIQRAKNKLEQELKETPTYEQIAKETGMKPSKVEEYYNFDLVSVSLDEPIKEGEKTRLLDIIPNDDENNQTAIEDSKCLKNILQTLMEEELTEREKKVMEYRNGFIENRIWTLDEIGKVFNITKEGVRKTEIRALKKLRAPKPLKQLEDYTGKKANTKNFITSKPKTKNKRRIIT